MRWPTSRSTSSCCSTPPISSSIFTTLIAGPSFATGVMPPSIPARPLPRTSKAFSSTAHRVCAPSLSCRLRALNHPRGGLLHIDRVACDGRFLDSCIKHAFTHQLRYGGDGDMAPVNLEELP